MARLRIADEARSDLDGIWIHTAADDWVEIVRVLHGARDLPSLFA